MTMLTDLSLARSGPNYVVFGVRGGAWYVVRDDGAGQFLLHILNVQRRRGFDPTELQFAARFATPREARRVGKACGLRVTYVHVTGESKEPDVLREFRPIDSGEAEALAVAMRSRSRDVFILSSLPKSALVEGLMLMMLRHQTYAFTAPVGDQAVEVGEGSHGAVSSFRIRATVPERHSA